MESIIEKAKSYVAEVFKAEYSGHDYFHTLRVYKTATAIAIKEKANLEIVQLAALLHDVDDVKLSPETHRNKDKARHFLMTHHMDEVKIQWICQIIDEISYRGTECVTPRTLEGKCVQDADRLDAIGAIGIARAFAYGGNHNRMMHDPNIAPNLDMTAEEYRKHISTTVNHFYEKLFKLKDLMNTEQAKQLAQDREQYMKDYIARFMAEWDGTQ
jgi:uncharacterized protein